MNAFTDHHLRHTVVARVASGDFQVRVDVDLDIGLSQQQLCGCCKAVLALLGYVPNLCPQSAGVESSTAGIYTNRTPHTTFTVLDVGVLLKGYLSSC
jgi:hypothetical protein